MNLKTNHPHVITEWDKLYGLFRVQAKSDLHMELTVLVKDHDVSRSENFQIFSTVPSYFDGWEREWWMKNLKKEIPEPREGLRTYTLRVTETMKWLHQIQFCFILLILFSLEHMATLHGGVVALNGKGLIFPGTPGSGKTSLVFALLKRGFRFLGDDYAFVDPKSLKAFPFPKSFTFRQESSELFEEVKEAWDRGDIIWVTEDKCYLNMSDLGINELGYPTHIDYILFPTYNPDSPPKLTQISKEKASKKLQEDYNLFSHAHPEKIKFSVEELASRLAESAGCYELITNEIDDTVDLILDLVDN
jgi:hypothetical protein